MEPNWLGGLMGGGLIGLAAVVLLWGNGRIAGISGIFGQLLLQPKQADNLWRLCFVLGLLLGAGGYAWLAGGLAVEMQTSTWGLILGGLCVGWGTQMGAGCTSGHGVCGLGRRSPRSLVAVLTFMLVAMLTVWLLKVVG